MSVSTPAAPTPRSDRHLAAAEPAPPPEGARSLQSHHFSSLCRELRVQGAAAFLVNHGDSLGYYAARSRAEEERAFSTETIATSGNLLTTALALPAEEGRMPLIRALPAADWPVSPSVDGQVPELEILVERPLSGPPSPTIPRPPCCSCTSAARPWLGSRRACAR